MMTFTNSLRFRLYLVLALLIGLFGLLAFAELTLIGDLQQGQAVVENANFMESNAYLLSSLAQRVASSELPTAENPLTDAIEETIANFDEILDELRVGNAEEDLDPVDIPELLPLLAELETEWGIYRALLTDFLARDRAEQPELLTQITNQSVVVFTFSERVDEGLEFLLEQQTLNAQRLTAVLVALLIVTLAFAVYVVTQTSRSIDGLTQTAIALAAGRLEIRANTHTLNEIAQTGEAFNAMAARIQALVQSLEHQVEEAQTARERAERADQVKSAFLASMSHELRTPLNAIINFSTFVADGDLGEVNENQRETLEEVVDSARHLLSLINDVLDMSKIESGTLTLFVEKNVQLQTLLDTAVNAAKGLLKDKPVEVRAEIDRDLPPLTGDRQRILQILFNMVSNACKFTEAGAIEIRAQRRGGEVEISVKDSGPGIEPVDQPAVFEAFKQTTTGIRKGGGTGLGMPISKNLAEAHGGRMWLQSQAGQGTTFFVVLPIETRLTSATKVSLEKMVT